MVDLDENVDMQFSAHDVFWNYFNLVHSKLNNWKAE
jgi:hypothetical protein